jgi:hypothetical protein
MANSLQPLEHSLDISFVLGPEQLILRRR